MHAARKRRLNPELTEMVREASRALACLDADRLEELAASCAVLNREVYRADAVERAELAHQARRAAGDMAIFARVLEATRANLAIMHRLRELRMGQIEYSVACAPPGRADGID